MTEDDETITAILNQFAAPVSSPAREQAAPPIQPDHSEYRAAAPFLADEERLYIHALMSNGEERLVSYACFVEAISVAPDRLAWVYTNGVLFARGAYLRGLIPELQQRRVKLLQPFDPTRYRTPVPGTPVIATLEWRRKEELLAEGNMS